VIRLLSDSFEGYRAFAEPNWEPPVPGPDEELATERILGDARVWFVVAEDDGGHAGQCGITPAHRRRNMSGEPIPGTAHLWQLFVRPDLWGSGLAADLHGRALDAMRSRGYTRARLLTPAGQARARAFYAREGWHEVAGPLPGGEFGLDLMELRREL
jgi:GNAT superfamily N-acetyltransferase